MSVEKVANYSPEATAALIEGYRTGKSVEVLASELGKTVRSVIAKLSKEGVYIPKAKAEGKREMLKAEMVAEIAKLTGVNEEILESLEKATGPALMVVLRALRAE